MKLQFIGILAAFLLMGTMASAQGINIGVKGGANVYKIVGKGFAVDLVHVRTAFYTDIDALCGGHSTHEQKCCENADEL